MSEKIEKIITNILAVISIVFFSYMLLSIIGIKRETELYTCELITPNETYNIEDVTDWKVKDKFWNGKDYVRIEDIYGHTYYVYENVYNINLICEHSGWLIE